MTAQPQAATRAAVRGGVTATGDASGQTDGGAAPLDCRGCSSLIPGLTRGRPHIVAPFPRSGRRGSLHLKARRATHGITRLVTESALAPRRMGFATCCQRRGRSVLTTPPARRGQNPIPIHGSTAQEGRCPLANPAKKRRYREWVAASFGSRLHAVPFRHQMPRMPRVRMRTVGIAMRRAPASNKHPARH